MFDVGFNEIVLIFVIGLVILGPERLPRVATKIGRWVGRARRTATQLRHQLEREIALNDIGQPIKRRPPAKAATPRDDESNAAADAAPRAADASDASGASGAADASGAPGAADTSGPPADAASEGAPAADTATASSDASGVQPAEEAKKSSNDPPAA